MNKKADEKIIIDGNIYKALIISAAEAIEANKEEVNSLNVFPVPDGDTGSNMSMTVANAANEIARIEYYLTVEESSALVAKAMLYGARGNSGVILSLLFKGIANGFKGYEESDGVIFAEALASGVKSAFSAVEVPAPGTILTVAEACSNCAKAAAKENNSFAYVLSEVIKTGEDALEKTIEQNPVLKKANVVDAGAKGLMLIFEAMYDTLMGGKSIEKPKAKKPSKKAEKPKEGIAAFDTDEIVYSFCTEFIVKKNRADENTEKFKAFLASIGDSLVFVDDDEILKVHVHTNDPCLVLGGAQHYGVFETVKVENMRSQHSSKLVEIEETEESTDTEYEKECGVVAVCSGDGISAIFSELGADHIVSGGQTMNPSTEDILSAIEKVDAGVVYVLPNNKNIIMAANQAKLLSAKEVFVIPTKSIPQGITAMLNFNPDLSGEENSKAMIEAISAVDTIQLTYAAKNSDFDGLNITEGDFLALYNDKIAAYGPKAESVWEKVAKKAKDAEKNMICIYYGAHTNEREAESLAKVFRKVIKDATVDVIYGGQPVYDFLISAEI